MSRRNVDLSLPSAAAAWLCRRGVKLGGTTAVVLHGPAAWGEAIPDAPLELLVSVRLPASQAVVAGWQTALTARLRAPVALTVMEAHRVGWLPPSVLQQSLLHGAILLWGDPAVVEVIPSWRPDQIDPRVALLEQTCAERDLAAGRSALAAYRAIGALLLAKRVYTPRVAGRAAAIRQAWPEAAGLLQAPASQVVEQVRCLIAGWLFTWEGTGLPPQAQAVYVDLWRRACALDASLAMLPGCPTTSPPAAQGPALGPPGLHPPPLHGVRGPAERAAGPGGEVVPRSHPAPLRCKHSAGADYASAVGGVGGVREGVA